MPVADDEEQQTMRQEAHVESAVEQEQAEARTGHSFEPCQTHVTTIAIPAHRVRQEAIMPTVTHIAQSTQSDQDRSEFIIAIVTRTRMNKVREQQEMINALIFMKHDQTSMLTITLRIFVGPNLFLGTQQEQMPLASIDHEVLKLSQEAGQQRIWSLPRVRGARHTIQDETCSSSPIERHDTSWECAVRWKSDQEASTDAVARGVRHGLTCCEVM